MRLLVVLPILILFTAFTFVVEPPQPDPISPDAATPTYQPECYLRLDELYRKIATLGAQLDSCRKLNSLYLNAANEALATATVTWQQGEECRQVLAGLTATPTSQMTPFWASTPTPTP